MKKLMCALMGLLVMLMLFGCSSKKPTEKMVEQDVLTYVTKSIRDLRCRISKSKDRKLKRTNTMQT